MATTIKSRAGRDNDGNLWTEYASREIAFRCAFSEICDRNYKTLRASEENGTFNAFVSGIVLAVTELVGLDDNTDIDELLGWCDSWAHAYAGGYAK